MNRPSADAAPAARLARAWAVLVDGMAAAGTAMIGVLMLVICADVVARNLLGASLPLVSELGALMLVMIVALQLATAVRHDRLARTDMVLGNLRARRPRAGALLAASFDLAGAVAIAVLAWATVGILGRDMARGEFIGITGGAVVPVWPFRAVIAAGLTIAAAQFALQTLALLRTAWRGPERRP